MKDPPSPHPSLRSGRAPEGGPFQHVTMRLPLRVWVWTAAVLALVVVWALLWRGSDAAATDSTTAAPADVPSGTPAGVVSAAWTAPTTAGGDGAARATVDGGRVVVGGEHGVRALEVGTGAEAWRYTRANARLCDWVLVGGRVVAVFGTEDRCDEAVALSVDTGVRAWTRNLDLRPDAVLTGTEGIVLATSPTGVLTLDPVGDSIRWRADPDEGCTFADGDVGAAGVAVVQDCEGTTQVRLLDGYQGTPLWTRDVAGGTTLAGVEQAVVTAGDDEVQLLAGADGAPLGPPVAGAADDVLVAGVGTSVLVWTGGTLTVADQGTGAVSWRTPATGLPGGPVDRALLAAEASVPVPEGDAVVLRDLATGDELQRIDTPGLRAGGLVTVTGPVVVHQLPDRVLAYR